MELTIVEFLTGLFNLIFVVISIVIGIKILLKYFKIRYKHFVSIGLIWIFISTPWMHGAIAFILFFFNIVLAEEIRFIIGYVFIPIAALLWYNTYTLLQNLKRRKLILFIYGIIVAVCEVLFFVFLFTDRINLIGYFERTFSAKYSPFVRFSLMFFLISSVLTFFAFAGASIKSKEPELKLKGEFLIIAFITYTVCAIFDSFFLLDPIIVVLIRVLLMTSALEFYIGWILPEPIKKLFLKK